MDIITVLKKFKRKFLIKRYGLRNVHPTFLATFGLKKVSKDLTAGAYSYVGPNCCIYPRTIIGKFTLLANDVMIIGGDHNFKEVGIPLLFAGREFKKNTVIGDDVWIGARSIIMCGVNIGNGAIIAAGAVVTKDIPPYEIWGGVPATRIGMRFNTKEKIMMHENMLKYNHLCFSENNLSSGREYLKHKK